MISSATMSLAAMTLHGFGSDAAHLRSAFMRCRSGRIWSNFEKDSPFSLTASANALPRSRDHVVATRYPAKA